MSNHPARRLTVFVESRKTTGVRFGLLQQQRLAVAQGQVVRGRKVPHHGNVSLGSFCSPNALRPSVPVRLALKSHCKRRWSDQDHLRLALDDQRVVYDCRKIAAKLVQCNLSFFLNSTRFIAVECPGIVRPKPQHLLGMRKAWEGLATYHESHFGPQSAEYVRNVLKKLRGRDPSPRLSIGPGQWAYSLESTVHNLEFVGKGCQMVSVIDRSPR
jgi:hypothetical protein